MSSQCFLTNIAVDLFILILRHLKVSDVVSVKRCSKYLDAIISSRDDCVQKFHIDFGSRMRFKEKLLNSVYCNASILNGLREIRLSNLHQWHGLRFNKVWTQRLRKLVLHFSDLSRFNVNDGMDRTVQFQCKNLRHLELRNAFIPQLNTYLSNLSFIWLETLSLYHTKIDTLTVQLLSYFVHLQQLKLVSIRIDNDEALSIKAFVKRQMIQHNHRHDIFIHLKKLIVDELSATHDAIEFIAYYILSHGNKHKHVTFVNDPIHPKPLFCKTTNSELHKLQHQCLCNIDELDILSEFHTVDDMMSYISHCVSEEGDIDDTIYDSILFNWLMVVILDKETNIKVNKDCFQSPNISTNWDLALECCRCSDMRCTMRIPFEVAMFENHSSFFTTWAQTFTDVVAPEYEENEDEDDPCYDSFDYYKLTLDCGYPITSLFGQSYFEQQKYNEFIYVFTKAIFEHYLSQWFETEDIKFEELTTQSIKIKLLIQLNQSAIQNILDNMLANNDLCDYDIRTTLQAEWDNKDITKLIKNNLELHFEQSYGQSNWTTEKQENQSICFLYIPPVYVEKYSVRRSRT
eukprot:502043_1